MAFDGDSHVSASLTEGASSVEKEHEHSHAKLYGEIAMAAGLILAAGALIASRGRTGSEVLPETEQALDELHGAGGGDIGLLERSEWNELLAARKARIIHGEFDPDAVSDFGPRRSFAPRRPIPRSPHPFLFPEGKVTDGPELPEAALERLVNAHRIGIPEFLNDIQIPRSRFAWLTDLIKGKTAS